MSEFVLLLLAGLSLFAPAYRMMKYHQDVRFPEYAIRGPHQ